MLLSKTFTRSSPHKKRARFLAVLWTLLIFIACLWPGKDIPEVPVPLIDKWVHFILFGVFAFLWLCAFPGRGWLFSLLIFALAFTTGWLVEELQGMLTVLGRTRDMMDALADGIGGALGVILFTMATALSGRASQK